MRNWGFPRYIESVAGAVHLAPNRSLQLSALVYRSGCERLEKRVPAKRIHYKKSPQEIR